jgi:ATP-dependent Clp protease ATP-binding subunit ClpB
MEELRRSFRPEFLNRVDETVVFSPLTLGQIERIVDIQLEALRRRLAERHVVLELDEAARRHIARISYDPVYGARPLKRTIQREIETGLGRRIIKGEVPDGARVRIGLKGEALDFQVTSPDASRQSTVDS